LGGRGRTKVVKRFYLETLCYVRYRKDGREEERRGEGREERDIDRGERMENAKTVEMVNPWERGRIWSCIAKERISSKKRLSSSRQELWVCMEEKRAGK
jgi:hypothetical protein